MCISGVTYTDGFLGDATEGKEIQIINDHSYTLYYISYREMVGSFACM